MAASSVTRTLPKSFSFLPKRIIALDEQGKAKHFRWQADRYGQIRIESQSEMTPFARAQKCVVFLDPRLMFRRRCPMPIASKADLNRIARDFFPFSSEQNVHFAYTKDGGDSAENVIFALPENDWLILQKNISAPALAVLPASADVDSIKAGLLQRFDIGAANDLIAKPTRILPPVLQAFAKLVLLFVTILAVGYTLWSFQYDWQQQKLMRDIATLQTEVQNTKQRYEAMQTMRSTLEDFDKFQAQENSRFFPILSRLIQTLPPGISIDRVEYKEGRLNISGLGRDPKEWLSAFGVDPSTIEITPLPQFNRYLASVPLSSTTPKQSLQP
ncbi:MAG: hypothetical protein EYC62_09440 [Alphaproteobacteria bacterium]|nr:MAG: hypothetical protein EYC62_09440 [Alphaproteobacteria bacterium]